MFKFAWLAGGKAENVVAAIARSTVMIEFDAKGQIFTANDNFRNAMGYALSEIQGRHHRMFVDPEYAQSAEYRLFWERLGQGEFDAREFKRFGKNGKEVWIQASYNPIKDSFGRVSRIH